MIALRTLVAAVYPPHCLACAAPVDETGALCPECWREARFLSGTLCDTCGVPLPGEADGGPLLCDECLTTPRPWSAGRAALAYTGTGRRLVLALKSADRTDLPLAAAGWMAQAGQSLILPDMCVAPVPLHRLRLFTRRYNQSALLSGALARRMGLTHLPDLLIRRRATPSQDGRGRDARFANLDSAIAVHAKRGTQIAGRPLLLIDDVMTSGATLAACAEAGFRAGAADVRVLTLARVVKDD